MTTVDGTVGYEADIKDLFRERDRDAMRQAADFDLWSFEDVRSRAQAILQMVESGRMPCDGSWSQDRVELFRRWVDTGLKP